MAKDDDMKVAQASDASPTYETEKGTIFLNQDEAHLASLGYKQGKKAIQAICSRSE